LFVCSGASLSWSTAARGLSDVSTAADQVVKIIARHESPTLTGLYDRSDDRSPWDEIERISK
jgi:hypothetical protein